MLLKRLCSGVVLLLFSICCGKGAVIEGPNDIIFRPNEGPVELTCTISEGSTGWRVNGSDRVFTLTNIREGVLAGHNVSGANSLLVINATNNTKYQCVSIRDAGDVDSDPAFLYIAAAPSMIAGVMIDLPDVDTVIVDNNNTNVSFTLNWVEPFANFDPIVNYTVTINCSDASCPVMLSTNNVTTTANVSFTTNLSMMTPLSVSASNTIGTSDPTTIMIAVPGDVGVVNLTCKAVNLINQCTVTWNPLPNDTTAPITYNVSYIAIASQNLSGSMSTNTSVATIDLQPVMAEVNVIVTAVNAFGSGAPSNTAVDEIMASSLRNVTSVVSDPQVMMDVFSAVITCQINPTSSAEYCQVIARSSTDNIMSSAQIMNQMATVTISGLRCEETYYITAGGINDTTGMLVGPQIRQVNDVTAGPCPTTTVMTSTMTSDPAALPSPTESSSRTADLIPTGGGTGASSDDDDNTGAIVGGVIGGICGAILVIIVIILIVYCCMKREKSSRPTSPGDRAVFRPASGTGSGVKVQTLDRYGKPVPLEGDTADTGVELTGYEAKSPEFTVTTSGPSSTFQGNDYQSAPGDEKNRTPSAFMPEGSYDTLAPADEPTAPSAQVVSPAQNGQSNPNAPKLNYADLEQFTRKPASVKKSDPQPASQYAVIDPKSLQQGTYT